MNNPYILQSARVMKNEKLTEAINLLYLDYTFSKFIPGQFVMISIPGYGEAPFGIMQPPCDDKHLEILVRKVGDLTTQLHQLEKNNTIYLRGPYGNGFPVNEWKNKNLTLIAGGTGIVPIKALIDYIALHRHNFGEIQLFYGVKSPEEVLFKKEINRCQKFAEVMLTAEKTNQNWQGNTGMITGLITNKTINVDSTIVVLCGPPLMYKFVIEKLKKLGFEDKNIYLSLERRMRCGIGKCQHCTCGEKYVCLDGPVFNYEEVLKFPEGL